MTGKAFDSWFFISNRGSIRFEGICEGGHPTSWVWALGSFTQWEWLKNKIENSCRSNPRTYNKWVRSYSHDISNTGLNILILTIWVFSGNNIGTKRVSHKREYSCEEYRLIVCSTVWVWFESTFRRNVSPPSSGQVNNTRSQVSRWLPICAQRKYDLTR
jgi:hypothetical protein